MLATSQFPRCDHGAPRSPPGGGDKIAVLLGLPSLGIREWLCQPSTGQHGDYKCGVFFKIVCSAQVWHRQPSCEQVGLSGPVFGVFWGTGTHIQYRFFDQYMPVHGYSISSSLDRDFIRLHKRTSKGVRTMRRVGFAGRRAGAGSGTGNCKLPVTGNKAALCPTTSWT